MTKYRGYYIDKVIFNNKADIDAFIRKQMIEGLKTRIEVVMLHDGFSMEDSIFIGEYEESMAANGFTWDEIEELECKFFEQAA